MVMLQAVAPAAMTCPRLVRVGGSSVSNPCVKVNKLTTTAWPGGVLPHTLKSQKTPHSISGIPTIISAERICR
jgi:hypothetical protein